MSKKQILSDYDIAVRVIGFVESAKLLGVSKQSVLHWRYRGFPKKEFIGETSYCTTLAKEVSRLTGNKVMLSAKEIMNSVPAKEDC